VEGSGPQRHVDQPRRDLMLACIAARLSAGDRLTCADSCAGRRFPGTAASAAGLPPGSLHENKVGNAFDTLEDIVYSGSCRTAGD